MRVVIDNQHEKLHRLNRHIGLTLRIMTAACLILLLAGMIMYLVTGASHPVEITPFPALLGNLLTFSPSGIITAGLIIMLLMPPVVLAISLAYFIAEKDVKPIIICIFLVLMLAISCILISK